MMVSPQNMGTVPHQELSDKSFGKNKQKRKLKKKIASKIIKHLGINFKMYKTSTMKTVILMREIVKDLNK